MKLFVAVVEAGGFRPAAQQLGVPASSVSDVMRRLEARLGVRLLNRNTRSVMPTDAGRRLLARLKPALDAISRAVDDLDDSARRPIGSLRLTVPEIVARYVLPKILPGFLLACPGVQVDVHVDNNVVDIVDSGFDAAIRYEERVARDMVAMPIGPHLQRFVAVAAPSYLALHGRPAHPRELAGHRLIGHRLPNGAMVAWQFGHGRQAVRITPSNGLITASIDLRVAAAVAGAGVLYTFEDVLRLEIEAGRLGRVCKLRLQPEQDHAQHDHGEVIDAALLVAGGDAAELLEAVDQTLDPVALPVGFAVEAGLPALVALAGDHRPDVSPAQAAAGGRAAVALVAGQSARPQARTALTRAADRAMVQQRLQRDLAETRSVCGWAHAARLRSARP